MNKASAAIASLMSLQMRNGSSLAKYPSRTPSNPSKSSRLRTGENSSQSLVSKPEMSHPSVRMASPTPPATSAPRPPVNSSPMKNSANHATITVRRQTAPSSSSNSCRDRPLLVRAFSLRDASVTTLSESPSRRRVTESPSAAFIASARPSTLKRSFRIASVSPSLTGGFFFFFSAEPSESLLPLSVSSASSARKSGLISVDGINGSPSVMSKIKSSQVPRMVALKADALQQSWSKFLSKSPSQYPKPLKSSVSSSKPRFKMFLTKSGMVFLQSVPQESLPPLPPPLPPSSSASSSSLLGFKNRRFFLARAWS
mmetsp:Transcript_92992/g.139582  ORF Transcript_92992/g.139582 Transcript_92992/m.139582 type:complete len:313 (+) Transcript_92992:952-1890(+)